MAGKGEELNQRLWKLFAKLGFQTKPNWNDPVEEEVMLAPGKKRTLDLSAVDRSLGVKIIGWAKARKRLTESITTHLHDYDLLRSKAQAQGVVFVATEKDFTEDDRNYANQVGIHIWGKEELEYYETLADTIEEYAKYEVIHSLGVETNEEKYTFNVLALNIRQPFPDSAIDLFLFSVPPEFLLRTAVVLRKAAGKKEAYQRILQKKRLAPIKHFVTSADALLPPNIIVHLGEDVSWELVNLPATTISGKRITLTKAHDYRLVLLSIPKKFASLELIDGQHRLFGFAHAEPATRDRFDLVVLGIANLSSKRRTETFVAINDKARRMDANLVTYLKYDPDETQCQGDHELMAIKVVVELNKVQPFHKAIRLLDVGKHRITLKGFAGYDLKGLLGPKGLLRKYYPQNQSAEYVQALRMYFGILKFLFPLQWKDPDEYIIFTNRGISAFLKLLKSILRTTQAPLSEESVKKYLAPIRSDWPDHRWETQKLASSYVGSQGWKDFHRDLVASVRRKYRNFRA